MSTILQSPGKLAMERRTPIQVPRADLAKTNRAGTASAFVNKLCSSKKRSGDTERRYQDYVVCNLNFASFCCLIVDD